MTNDQKAELVVLLLLYKKESYAGKIVNDGAGDDPLVSKAFSSLLKKTRVERVMNSLEERRLIQRDDFFTKTATGKHYINLCQITDAGTFYLFSNIAHLMSV